MCTQCAPIIFHRKRDKHIYMPVPTIVAGHMMMGRDSRSLFIVIVELGDLVLGHLRSIARNRAGLGQDDVIIAIDCICACAENEYNDDIYL